MMETKPADASLLQAAERRLRRLSLERLRAANDFLAYLEEREENEATQELLNLPGFEVAFSRAVEQARAGEVVSFEDEVGRSGVMADRKALQELCALQEVT